ncbi:MAG TPA: HAD family phosphatase [Anaerolineales bacterium]|jgi:epoxide hydrolase-like predicted phosphatase
MPFRAVFFDLGGVIVRTEYQAPRQHLAQRLGMEYDDLTRAVFDSESARKASVGTITEDAHWAALAGKLRRPASEMAAVRAEFFAGDVLDLALVDFIRSLRPRYKTGLISNAWDGLRPYLLSQKLEQAFDVMIISAEAGLVKPEAGIFQLALEQAGVAAREAVFVDDMPENIESAREVGMSGILFRDRDATVQQINKLLKQ